jgi:hypothetical protein
MSDSSKRIKIHRSYTLPQSREDRGRIEMERLEFDPEVGDTAVEWAVEALRNAGCTRDNVTNYITEEPKVTDFSRGEEMTASARLYGFAEDEERAVNYLLTRGGE